MLRPADLLTVLRFLLLPFLFFCLARGNWTVALAILTIAGLSDLLDGALAKSAPRPSRHGAILDLAADLLLILGTFMILWREGFFSPLVPSLALLSFGSFCLACLRRGAVARHRFGRYTGAFCWVILGAVLLVRPDRPGTGPTVLRIVQPLLALGLAGSIVENLFSLHKRTRLSRPRQDHG